MATDLVQTGKDKKLDDGISSVKFYSLATAIKLVETNKIIDGQTIASLFFARDHINKL